MMKLETLTSIGTDIFSKESFLTLLLESQAVAR